MFGTLEELEEELSEAYNDYLETTKEPLSFREWLNYQDEPDIRVKEDDGGGVYVE